MQLQKTELCVKKCPPGFAWGYSPINGSNVISNLQNDTQNVSVAVLHPSGRHHTWRNK